MVLKPTDLIWSDHNNYIHDAYYVFNQTRDYLTTIMAQTAIFKTTPNPNIPILRDHFSQDPRMHYSLRPLLVALHKLNIRPTL